MNEKLTEAEFETLAELLVKHNRYLVANTDAQASVQGRVMDSALCMDTFHSLARNLPYSAWDRLRRQLKIAD